MRTGNFTSCLMNLTQLKTTRAAVATLPCSASPITFSFCELARLESPAEVDYEVYLLRVRGRLTSRHGTAQLSGKGGIARWCTELPCGVRVSVDCRGAPAVFLLADAPGLVLKPTRTSCTIFRLSERLFMR